MSGIVGAWLMLLVQQFLQRQGLLEPWRLLDYTSINLTLYAFLFGGGALFGDAFESAIKRRLGKKEGVAWVPFDQVDFVLGALVFLSPFYIPSPPHIVVLLLLSPLLHFLTCILGYVTGMKDHWW